MVRKVLLFILILFSFSIYFACAATYEGDMAEGAIGDTSGPEGDEQDIDPGQLTAGEWNDLENWNYWIGLMENSEWSSIAQQWGFNIKKKFVVQVKNTDKPIVDAVVKLQDDSGNTIWINHTDNKGNAYLFKNVFGEDRDIKKVLVEYKGETTEVEITEEAFVEPLEIDISSQPSYSDTIDIMFMIDTTGSMGDELEYIKSELSDVITRVKNNIGEELNIRLSCNYYRDYGDEYLVRSFPFTTDINKVLNQIKKQSANGGGDYPEAVDEAIKDAVANHNWSKDAVARLMFFVLDAPPHNEQHIISTIHEMTIQASDNGIRIIPVSASGVNKDTEFLLRFMSILTGGTYTFITNHSGIGEEHIEPTIGQYEIELLNDLLVRIITEFSSIE